MSLINLSKFKYLIMLRNQVLLVRSALITVFILLTVFTFKAFFAGENLFWMPVILLPLLIFSFFQIRQKKYPVLWKYFIERQQINASQQDSTAISPSSSSIKAKKNDLTVLIGNKNDPQSYKASVFNIRMRNKAVKSLADKSFASETVYCDDANVYDLIEGDRIFHVGPDYTGCQTKRGGFDAEKFKELAGESTVKIIELDLSTPRYPLSNLISAIGTSYVSVASNKTTLSTLGYTMFSDADGMIFFLEQLHTLSGGKPVGIKLRIENKKELYNICYAIKKAKFNPHFIIVESAEQIGFRSPHDTSPNSMPLYEAVLFTSKTLEVYELDKKIKIIAAANILSGADLLKLVSLGANAVWSEVSGYKIVKMNRDGTNEHLVYGRRDVAEFHNNIISTAAKIMEANGLKSVNEITLSTFFKP
jgi:hypothetical protein